MLTAKVQSCGGFKHDFSVQRRCRDAMTVELAVHAGPLGRVVTLLPQGFQ